MRVSRNTPCFIEIGQRLLGKVVFTDKHMNRYRHRTEIRDRLLAVANKSHLPLYIKVASTVYV